MKRSNVLSVIICIFFSLTVCGQNATTGENVFTGNQYISTVGKTGTTPMGNTGPRFFIGSENDNTDPFSFYRYNISSNKSDLRIEVGDDKDGDDRLVVGSYILGSIWNPFFTVTNNGNVEATGIINSKGLNINGSSWINGSLYLAEPNVTTPMGQYGKRLSFGNYGENGDDIFIARFNVKNDISELRVNVGDDENDKFIVGRKYWSAQEPDFTSVLVVAPRWAGAGYVGINVYDPKYELDVNGTIRAKEIIVETGWADFVFNKDYKLPSLNEVEAHIQEHKHLPGIPSEVEVKENGIALSNITTKMMQKIEELTLYAIQQEKRLQEQEALIRELQEKISVK